MEKIDDVTEYRSVIDVFAHYGFRRSSMEDLSQAVGVSRQTLYKRFGTKEAVRDWAVGGFVQAMLRLAEAELAAEDRPVEVCLLNAFMRWTGDHVTLLRTAPHGSEILDIGAAALRASRHDPVGTFEARVTGFLVARGVTTDRKDAAEIAYVLAMAAKGLLMACETSDGFAAGMGRIIALLLNRPQRRGTAS